MAAKLAPSADLTGLQAIWLYRMIFTPHPLRERMTLFWHGHFATSIAKVQSPALMQRQNNLLRAQALGDFCGLLRSIGRDPAMLIWLDSTINRKARPNENYAREVMELFSLGRGHYSEKDIQEAARAFTGWFVIRDEFQEVPASTTTPSSTCWAGRGTGPATTSRQSCSSSRPVPNGFAASSSGISSAIPNRHRSRYSRRWPRLSASRTIRSRCPWPGSCARACSSTRSCGGGGSRARSNSRSGRSAPWKILKPTVEAARAAEACVAMGQSLYAPPSVAGWEGRAGLDQLDHDARPRQPGPPPPLRGRRRPWAGAAIP